MLLLQLNVKFGFKNQKGFAIELKVENLGLKLQYFSKKPNAVTLGCNSVIVEVLMSHTGSK